MNTYSAHRGELAENSLTLGVAQPDLAIETSTLERRFTWGVGGLAALSGILCCAVPIAIPFLFRVNSPAILGIIASLIPIFYPLAAPPIAALSLLGLVPMAQQWNLTRSCVALFCLLVPIAIVSAAAQSWAQQPKSWGVSRFPANSYFLFAGLWATAALVAIAFPFVLRKYFGQSQLRKMLYVGVAACVFLILSSEAGLIFDVLQLVDSEIPIDRLAWHYFSGACLSILPLTAGAWFSGQLAQAASPRRFSLGGSPPENTRQGSIFGIMELTLIVALVCALLRGLELRGGTIVMIGIDFLKGILSGLIALGCLRAMLTPYHNQRFRGVIVAFLLFALAVGGLTSSILILQFGLSQVGDTLLRSTVSGVAASVLYTGTLVIGILWLRYCGWQMH